MAERREPARKLLELAGRLAGFAPGPLGRAEVRIAVLLVPLKQRVDAQGRLGLPLRLQVGGRTVTFFFGDHSELMALDEALVQGEYDVTPAEAPRHVVDLGANAGQAALYFRGRFPDAEILSVEPASACFRRLERNTAGDPHIALRRCAITAQSGQVRLSKSNLSWTNHVSSISSDGADSGFEWVEAVSLEKLFDDAGLDRVDLLKADIEGLEYEALVGSPALKKVGMLVGEVHENLIPVDKHTLVEKLQADGGFDSARFIKNHIFVLEREPRDS
jgi:FkbM family methyltransferase